MGAKAGLGLTLKRQPGAGPEPLWFEWLALAGVLGFATWLLGVRGVWALLLRSDPTGITLVIVIVFAASTLWCGARARVLQAQHDALGSMRAAPGERWAADYWAALSHDKADADTALDLLMEHPHGPHGTAWWVNGVQLKLGLLGKVIGFSILALDIGTMQGFEAAVAHWL